MKKNSKKKGFTLIELIAVIAILGILGAVLIPNITGYLNRAKRANVISGCKVITNAIDAYDADAATAIDESVTATVASTTIQGATGTAPYATPTSTSIIPTTATITQIRAVANGTTAEKDITITSNQWVPK